MAIAGQADLVNRMVRAAKVEPALYEEVERDLSATQQAFIVVMIVAVAAGIGAALSAVLAPASVVVGGQTIAVPRNPIGSFIQSLISTPIAWVVWSYITYFVGTRLFNGTATPGEMLRTIGFAQSPQVLGVLSFIPIIGWLVSLVLFFWSIYAGFVAVRQGLDLDTGKSIATIVIGAIAAFIALAIIGGIIGAILSPFVR